MSICLIMEGDRWCVLRKYEINYRFLRALKKSGKEQNDFVQILLLQRIKLFL